jgi:hypothetical protein
VRGEPLSEPVYYRNAQWAVTGYGIEELPETNGPIDAEQIGETRKDAKGRATYYNLPLHLASRQQVNIELFLDAFMRALVIHRKRHKGPVSLKLFIATADAARDRAKSARNMRPAS